MAADELAEAARLHRAALAAQKALSEAASNLVNVSRTPASKEPTAKP